VNIDDDVNFTGDQKKLSQMINNLLSNAVKFTKEGFIKIELHRDDNSVKLTVQDSGIGISKKDQKNLFEKFFKIDNEYTRETGGTGLGLTIAKKIIDVHHATVEVTSDLDKGTTFDIFFPIEY
ncbi:sensor histidine kinase, partial [candidate division KSB1 bacterium]